MIDLLFPVIKIPQIYKSVRSLKLLESPLHFQREKYAGIWTVYFYPLCQYIIHEIALASSNGRAANSHNWIGW